MDWASSAAFALRAAGYISKNLFYPFDYLLVVYSAFRFLREKPLMRLSLAKQRKASIVIDISALGKAD